jgi:serine/threonine-protein kinase
MPVRARPLALPLALALFALHEGAARGQPATPAPSPADVLFADGRALVDAGRYVDAIAKFTESEKLDPGVGTMLNLAYCYEQIGKTGTAWSTYRAAAAAAREQHDDDREHFAEGRAASLEASLAHLTVLVPPTGEPDDLAITVDGAVLSRDAWGLTSAVDPGAHAMHATAERRRAWDHTVEVTPGEAITVTVPVLEAEAPPVTPQPPAPVAPRPGAPRWQEPVALTAGGAGVVCLGLGLAFTLSAKSRYDGSFSHCSAHDGCDATGLAARHAADSDADVATGTTIAGAALVAGGLALWLLSPRPKPQRSGIVLVPAVGPTSAGLTLHRVW